MVCSSQEVAALLAVPIRKSMNSLTVKPPPVRKLMNSLPVQPPPMRKSKISLLLSLPGMEVDDFLASEPPRARPLAHNLRKLSLRASRNLHETFTGCNKVFLKIICPPLHLLHEFPYSAYSGKEIEEFLTVEPPFMN